MENNLDKMQERKLFSGSREKLKLVTEFWWAEHVAGERAGSETMPHWGHRMMTSHWCEIWTNLAVENNRSF